MNQPPIHLNQMALVTAIINEVCRQAEEQGITPGTIPRQMNSVINAANDILATFRIGYTPAEPNCGFQKWVNSDDVGQSSLYMAKVFHGSIGDGVLSRAFLPSWVRIPDSVQWPHDPSDFNRCVKLLESCPGFLGMLPMMKTHGLQWANLVEHWAELEALLQKERAGEKTDLYERMKSYGC